MIDLNALIDTSKVATLAQSVSIPSFSGFSTLKIMILAILLLIIVFGGSKFVGNLFRIGAFVILVAVLFEFIKV